MRSPRSLIAATALAAATITLAAAGPAAHAKAGGLPAGQAAVTNLRLPDSVAPFAAASAAAGAVPAATKLTIQFWMKPRSAAAARYAAAVSTPGNPLFRHFLSPAGYTARFGPTQAAVASVESWLRSKGFTGVGADLGRDYVQATASVSTIEAALRARLNYYRTRGLAAAGRYPLRANDRPVSLPASIARRVLGVTGLDNAAPTMTYVREGVTGTGPRHPGWLAGVRLLAVVPAALRDRPAQDVRRHQFPHVPLRVHAAAAPPRLQPRRERHRQGRHRGPGRGGADPGHVPDPDGLRHGSTTSRHPPPRGTTSCRSARVHSAATRSTSRSNWTSRRPTAWRRRRTSSWWAATRATTASSACRPCSTPTWRYSTASAAARSPRSRPTPGSPGMRASRPTCCRSRTPT